MSTEEPKVEMPPYKPPSPPPPPQVVPPTQPKTRGKVQRATPPAGLEGWTPTANLRWSGDVLEQQWAFFHQGDPPETEFQWMPVPST